MKHLVAYLTFIVAVCQSFAVFAADGVSILMYHRFGDSRYPSTNVTLEQFDRHIEILTTGGYTVMDLSKAVEHLQTGTPFPDKAVVITVDDAYASVYEHAAPRLKAAGLPWTLFVATDAVDRGFADLMTWDQIREVQEGGATIGAHSHSHAHLPELPVADVKADLARMSSSFERELGAVPPLFAYPYGEAVPETMTAVQDAGFIAAFGQHSGAASQASNMAYISRFPINESYGSEDRFLLVSSAKAVPLKVQPAAYEMKPMASLIFTLTKTQQDAALPNLSCFTGTGRVLDLTPTAEGLTLAYPKPETPGRQRFNCTAPAGDGSYFWFGHQFLAKRDE